jgi:hypothetical protein
VPGEFADVNEIVIRDEALGRLGARHAAADPSNMGVPGRTPSSCGSLSALIGFTRLLA